MFGIEGAYCGTNAAGNQPGLVSRPSNAQNGRGFIWQGEPALFVQSDAHGAELVAARL